MYVVESIPLLLNNCVRRGSVRAVSEGDGEYRLDVSLSAPHPFVSTGELRWVGNELETVEAVPFLTLSSTFYTIKYTVNSPQFNLRVCRGHYSVCIIIKLPDYIHPLPHPTDEKFHPKQRGWGVRRMPSPRRSMGELPRSPPDLNGRRLPSNGPFVTFPAESPISPGSIPSGPAETSETESLR